METSPKRKCSCSGTFASLVSRMLLLLSVFTHLGGGCSGDEKEDSTNTTVAWLMHFWIAHVFNVLQKHETRASAVS